MTISRSHIKGTHGTGAAGKDTGGKCEKWRVHKPSECEGGAPFASKRGSPDRDSKTKKGAPASKKLKISKAYVARFEKRRDDSEQHVNTDDESE